MQVIDKYKYYKSETHPVGLVYEPNSGVYQVAVFTNDKPDYVFSIQDNDVSYTVEKEVEVETVEMVDVVKKEKNEEGEEVEVVTQEEQKVMKKEISTELIEKFEPMSKKEINSIIERAVELAKKLESQATQATDNPYLALL